MTARFNEQIDSFWRLLAFIVFLKMFFEDIKLTKIPPQVSDLVVILNQRRAIEAFTKGGNLTLGGNLTVAVGPMGRLVSRPWFLFVYKKVICVLRSKA